MSIIDSRADREAARIRVGVQDEAQLREDLAFWSVAAHDAREDQRDALERLQQAARRFAEASEWVELLAAELRRRRDARVGG